MRFLTASTWSRLHVLVLSSGLLDDPVAHDPLFRALELGHGDKPSMDVFGCMPPIDGGNV
jgi:hypothetical protein